jgi:hypothetical protein
MKCFKTQVTTRHHFCLVAGVFFVGVTAGCGGPANKYDAVVTGTVTIDGELAPSGTVTFHPVAKDGKIATGRIYPDGSFSLRTGQGDLRDSDGGTVVPGEYIVTIMVAVPPPAPTSVVGGPPVSGPLLIDKRYVSRDTTDLRATISEGDNIVHFDLERAAPAETATEAAEPADAGQLDTSNITDSGQEDSAEQNEEPATANPSTMPSGESPNAEPAEATKEGAKS